MFIRLVTNRDEIIVANINKIMFFGQDRKGTVSIVFDDGTSTALLMSLEDIQKQLQSVCV